MNAKRILPALILGAVVLLAIPARSEAQEARVNFQFQFENRALVKVAPFRWAQVINGQVTRYYVEQDRNLNYVLLYTEVPGPTWVRVFHDRVYWRAPGDFGWRVGAPGKWIID